MTEKITSTRNCPLCGDDNRCGNLSSDNTEPCWCMADDVSFPEDLTNQVPLEMRNKACICQKCAQKFANADKLIKKV